jgi:hypothetical protein
MRVGVGIIRDAQFEVARAEVAGLAPPIINFQCKRTAAAPNSH